MAPRKESAAKTPARKGSSAAKSPAKAKSAPRKSAAGKATARVNATEQTPEDKTAECKHSWLIEPPNGPTSNGSCTICGETREFKNSYEYTPSWTARSGKAGPPNAPKGPAAKK